MSAPEQTFFIFRGENGSGEYVGYKALTDDGLRYGINRPQQMIDETTPRYYEDSFQELVAKFLSES